MRKFYAMLFASILGLVAQAQTASKVYGTVRDAEGKTIPAVTVSLLRSKDSSLAKLAVTDKVGQYELVNVKPGAYLLSYTSVGFEKVFSNALEVATAPVEVAPITLPKGEAKNMAAVTVTARRPLVEAKIDRMIVNVDASPTNAGNTALDVLEKSPGITLDRDGNISLKGKQGVIVLMDGKQTYLNGQDLANLLKNLPANQLDQIEIMSQPSAKYDASGNSGVINLKTKKSIAKGFNGSVNLAYVQGRYPKSPNSVNFNYRKNKVNLFSNAGYGYFEGFNELNLSRKFRDAGTQTDTFSIVQQGNMRFSSKNVNARIGLDYSINKKTSIGFNLNASHSIRSHKGKNISDFLDRDNNLVSLNEADSRSKDVWKNVGANINLRKALNKPGKEFSADVDLITYSSRNSQVADNYTYTPSKLIHGTPYLLKGDTKQDIAIYSAKVDYTQPLEKEAKLEVGAKSSYVKIDNNAPYRSFDHLSNTDTLDSRSDHFVYDENINAAYINYSRQMKKWGVQTGLRLEHTYSIANSLQLSKKIPNNYVQFFPTAYLSYKMNDKNNFGLSYGRRLQRPGYQDLNPFQQILDKYTFQQGNPYLTPQFSDNIELSHNYRGALNTVINYSNTTDIINEVIKQNDETKETFQTKDNIATRRNIGLAVSYNAPITKWWTTSVYVNVFNNHFEGLMNNKPLDVSLTSGMMNMSQQFRFAKTWNAEVNGFYRAKSQEGGIMLADPMGVVSFGLGKQVMKGKGTIKLNVTDPFYIQQFRGLAKFDNVNLKINSRWDNRRVGVNFSYRFSKGQTTQQRKKTGSAQDEQNRVGGAQQ